MADNYERAGVHDLAAFYAQRFVGATPGSDYYEGLLHRHDVNFARFQWFDRHIRAGSTVLDFGCGTGTLAFLVAKRCRVFGIELSAEAARQAMAAGYEDVFVGDVDDIAESTDGFGFFDYVVSVDVLGHIEFGAKDQLIANLKRFLKPDGAMLHAIECDEVDYPAMSDAELRDYVGVDGHVGLEPRSRILSRFQKLFTHADGEVRLVHCAAQVDQLKSAQTYGDNLPSELLAYLEQLGPSERQAFDIAAGIANNSLEDHNVSSDDGSAGLMLLRASDAPLTNQRHNYLPQEWARPLEPGDSIPLDSPWLIAGWHPVDPQEPRPARWTAQWALIYAPVSSDVRSVAVRFTVPDESVPSRVRLGQKGLESVLLECDRSGEASGHTLALPVQLQDGYLSVRIETNRVHVPAWSAGSTDWRTLGVRVEAIHLR